MNFNDPENVTEGFDSPSMNRHLQAYAVQTDRLVNALSAAIAQATSQNQTVAAQRYMDPTFRLGVAAANNILTGNGPGGLIQGIASSIGTTLPSFSSNISGSRVTEVAMGRGTLTDQFAKNVFDHIQKNYFNYLGLGNQSRTMGMTRNQMGQVFDVMGQRGMVAGLFGGTADIRGRAIDIKTPEKTFQRIDEQFKKTAQVLGIVKSMFGATGSMAELANIAESVTGITMGPGSMNSVISRLQTINSFAKTTGLGVGAAAQIISASSRSVGQFGPGMAGALAAGAAQTSGLAFRGLQAASNLAAERGNYIAPRDVQQIQQAETVMRGQLLTENPLMAESLFVMQNIKTLTPQQSAGLQAAVTQFQNAGTIDERNAANSALHAAIEKATGVQAGTITRKLGGVEEVTKNLSPAAQQRLSDALGQNLLRSGVNELTALATNTGMTDRFGLSATQIGQAGMALMGGLNAQTRDELTTLLESGDIAGANQLLQSKASILQQEGLGAGTDVLTSLFDNPATAAKFIQEMGVMAPTLQTMMSTTAAEDRRIQESILARQKVSGIFDLNLVEKPGTIEQVIRNTLGQNVIGNEEKMRYLMAAGGAGIETFNIDNIGQTAEEADRLNKVMQSYGVDLYKQFNIDPGNTEGLANALKSDKNKLYNLLSDKGVVGAQMAGNKVGLALRGSADIANKELELYQQAKTSLILGGADSAASDFDQKLKTEVENLKTSEAEGKGLKPEDSASAAAKRVRAIERDFVKTYTTEDVLKTATNEDSQRFKDLLEISKKQPDLLDPMFKSAEKQIKEDKNLKQGERDDRLKQLTELQDKLKEAKSGKNFFGTLELKGDRAMIKMFEK